MPILALEPTLFPNDLLIGIGRAEARHQDVDRAWWCMHTKSRQEKSLSRALSAKRVPHYLPLVARNVLVRGRSVQSYVPVFAGYVFVFGTIQEREVAIRTNRICQALPVIDGPGLCADLARVQTLIDSGFPLTVEARFQPGQRVRVRHGALDGLEGIVLRRKRETRLIVDVRMLQQGVSVEIDDFCLEPIYS